jgi:hypothetical protein
VDTPLPLGQQTFHFVAHVLRLEHPGPRREDGDDTTIGYWEIRDPSGNAVFTTKSGSSKDPEVYEDAFSETESADAKVFHTQNGDGIWVNGESEPSTPDTGNWIQLFGLKDGKLKAFGQLDSNSYEGLSKDSSGADILKFSEHFEYFDLFYVYSMNWKDITLDPVERCLPSAGAQQEHCLYSVHAQPGSPHQASIQLYGAAEEHGQPQLTQVRPESKIEFIETQIPVKLSHDYVEPYTKFEDMWLRVRVDGKEGWVHSQEDFVALGLHASG